MDSSVGVGPGFPDTDARIDAKSSAVDQLNETATPPLTGNATEHDEQSRFFAGDSDETNDGLDGFVGDISVIAESQCEHCEDYAAIETLICCLPIDHLTFAAHDSSAPYSMALLVRAFIIKEINGWDETALHDYLRANPALRRKLGFETLPNQSTFWRAWNHRCSEQLRDAVRECAESIVTAARACGVSLPERIDDSEADGSQTADCPERQLLAQKTDEVWQQAKPFVTDAFALDRGPNWEIHENAFWEQHAYI